MKAFGFIAGFLALAFVGSFAEPSSAAGACPSFTIKTDVGKIKMGGDEAQAPRSAVFFTAGPTPADAVFNWTVSGGTIIDGQGTAAIVVDAQGLEGQTVTATLEVLGLDAACAKQATVSATATVK